MSDRGFENAPDMGHDFAEAGHDSYDAPLDYDAQDWEPTEEPSEKHLEMHYTPGGSLEEEVHAELDAAARARIAEAQREGSGSRDLPDEQEIDFAGDFDEARRNAWGWDPESQREYEGLTDEYNARHDNQPFETGRRFEREWEPERGGDDWER